MSTIIVTGSSGFIGYYTCLTLLARWDIVIGIDNENTFYTPLLKQARRSVLEQYDNFHFYQIDLADNDALTKVFAEHKVDKIIHLAAQAGVRYGIENPHAFVSTNIVGFHNLLDLSYRHECANFVYASTGSVYGMNEWGSGHPDDQCDAPLGIYAASKKSSELIAHSYSYLHGVQTIWLRFFNVYGPWGRPDSAYYKFTSLMMAGKPIDVYNHGNMERNNTYVTDIVDGVIRATDYDNGGKYEIFNLGNEKLIPLMYFIERIEHQLGITADKNFMEIQPGEIPSSRVDSSRTKEILWREPQVSFEDGMANFVQWYQDVVYDHDLSTFTSRFIETGHWRNLYPLHQAA